MSDITNLRDTIVPKSDQLNSEQLIAGPMMITVTNVRRGDGEQPLVIGYHGDNGRPYKPCKTMRKVLIFAWGEDGSQWIGRSMTLFNDPAVKFGGVAVGGIRISHLSHIDRELKLSLTATRGKKDPFIILRSCSRWLSVLPRSRRGKNRFQPSAATAFSAASRRFSVIRSSIQSYRSSIYSCALSWYATRRMMRRRRPS